MRTSDPDIYAAGDCVETVDLVAGRPCCAPACAPAMDNIITAANVARNKLDGHMVGVSSEEVHRMLKPEERLRLSRRPQPGRIRPGPPARFDTDPAGRPSRPVGRTAKGQRDRHVLQDFAAGVRGRAYPQGRRVQKCPRDGRRRRDVALQEADMSCQDSGRKKTEART